MSWKATAFVKELRDGLSITEKFVLLILADYHRTDGKNEWPSMATLASDCLMTERGVQQVIARLDGSFIRREIGGGRGNNNAYKFIGLDIAKGEQETPNGCAVNGHSVNETPHSRAENPAQPSDKPRTAVPRNKVLQDLPVKEPNGEEIPPDLHPLNYGEMLLTVLELPLNFSNKTAAADTIQAEITAGKSPPSAYEFVLAGCLDARHEGWPINKFFLQDAKHRFENRKANPSGKQSGATSTAGTGNTARDKQLRSIASLRHAATQHAPRGDARNPGER